MSSFSLSTLFQNLRCWLFRVDDALRDKSTNWNQACRSKLWKEGFVKYQRIWTALLLSFTVAMSSCTENDSERITLPDPGSYVMPAAPGLIGTFSGTVRNTAHTKSGTLTISITSRNPATGQLNGTLTLTGFSNCFSKGVFSDPAGQNNNYDNYYVPQRGFGSIMAIGPQPGSRSFLYFLASDNFNQGLQLDGITETLAFTNGHNWCLEIDAVILKRE